MTGQSYAAGGDTDCTTVKYDSPGKEWVIRYNGPGNPYDFAFAMAVDESANVYVTGESNADYTRSSMCRGLRLRPRHRRRRQQQPFSPTPTPKRHPVPQGGNRAGHASCRRAHGWRLFLINGSFMHGREAWTAWHRFRATRLSTTRLQHLTIKSATFPDNRPATWLAACFDEAHLHLLRRRLGRRTNHGY